MTDIEKPTVTRARARARVVDDIVVEIARWMVDGAWTLEKAGELATREGVRPGTVEQWASDAGRLLRIGVDMDALRAVNVRRLDETYQRARHEDPKAAVAAISEQNRMLGLHAPERVSVTVKAYADLDDETMLARIEERIAEYQQLRDRLKAKLRIVDAEPVEMPGLPAKGDDDDA